jgi:hypothetical protein
MDTFRVVGFNVPAAGCREFVILTVTCWMEKGRKNLAFAGDFEVHHFVVQTPAEENGKNG